MEQLEETSVDGGNDLCTPVSHFHPFALMVYTGCNVILAAGGGQIQGGEILDMTMAKAGESGWMRSAREDETLQAWRKQFYPPNGVHAGWWVCSRGIGMGMYACTGGVDGCKACIRKIQQTTGPCQSSTT